MRNIDHHLRGIRGMRNLDNSDDINNGIVYLKWFVVFLDAGDKFSHLSIQTTQGSPHRPRNVHVESIKCEGIGDRHERIDDSREWIERFQHRIEVDKRQKSHDYLQQNKQNATNHHSELNNYKSTYKKETGMWRWTISQEQLKLSGVCQGDDHIYIARSGINVEFVLDVFRILEHNRSHYIPNVLRWPNGDVSFSSEIVNVRLF